MTDLPALLFPFLSLLVGLFIGMVVYLFDQVV